MTAVVIGGLVTWLLTKIVVESEIARPLRDWVGKHTSLQAMVTHGVKKILGLATDNIRIKWHQRVADKVYYLLTCVLCAGVWIGWLVALVITGPYGLIVNGLAYKAVAHLLYTVEQFLDRQGRPATERATGLDFLLQHPVATSPFVDPRHPSVQSSDNAARFPDEFGDLRFGNIISDQPSGPENAN